MTKTGQQFIDEFISEANEKLKDDEKRIFFSQAITSVKNTFWYVLRMVFQGLSTMFLITGVSILIFIEPSWFDDWSKMNSVDKVEMIRTIKMLFSYCLFITMFIYTFIAYRRIIGSKFEQRLHEDQQEANLLIRIVEVQEELLVRHGLIEAEYNEKNN